MALGVSACGASLFVPPATPGAPDATAVDAWRQARHACAGASTYSAELHVSGRAGADRRKLSATLEGAVTRDDRIRLEYVVPLGRPGFVLAGNAARATLVLRDGRVVTAPAADIIEALTGVRLAPRALLDVLSGCVAAGETATAGLRYHDMLGVQVDTVPVYLKRQAGVWRIVAGERPTMLVDYAAFEGGWPSTIRIVSTAQSPEPFSLSLNADQINVNVTIPPRAFEADVPATATPMSLDELRASGPLGGGEP